MNMKTAVLEFGVVFGRAVVGSTKPECLVKSYNMKKTGGRTVLLDGCFCRWKGGSSMFVFPASNGLLTRHEWTPGRQEGSILRSITCYLVGNGPRAFFPGDELSLC
jgi:hypothetical protein